MSEVVTCPICSETAECAAQSGRVLICGVCGATLVCGAVAARLATADDTAVLSADDLQLLRRARGRLVRPERRQR